MESVQNAASLSKLVKICKYGVWVTAIAIAITAVILAGSLTELALCLSDPMMSVFPLDHNGTLVDIVQDSLSAAGCLVGCVMLYRICETVSAKGIPFNYDNVRSVRNIAWICIATFFLILAAQTVMVLVLDPGIYQFEFPFQILVMGAITYIFSLLFEYGTVLQTESDEFLRYHAHNTQTGQDHGGPEDDAEGAVRARRHILRQPLQDQDGEGAGREVLHPRGDLRHAGLPAGGHPRVRGRSR